MSGLAVLEVPQWQGSSSVTARRLVVGARELADLLPVARRVRPQVDVRSGGADAAEGVRDLDVLAANLGAVRAALGPWVNVSRSLESGSPNISPPGTPPPIQTTQRRWNSSPGR